MNRPNGEPGPRLLRIALFNDTGSSPHVGCLAVSDAHNRLFARGNVAVVHRSFVNQHHDLWREDASESVEALLTSPLGQTLAGVDAVVVNGEGTIHHRGGRHLLTILAAAQELGRPTFLLNAVFQESETHLDTLRRLNDFTVRDLSSARYAASLDIPHRLVMDSILEARFAAHPSRDFSGKIVITDHHAARDHDVGNFLRQITTEFAQDIVYYPLFDKRRRADWRHAVADLATAKLLITARHHGVYLAGLAGIPFVPLGSNTWKIEGTLAMFGPRPSVCATFRELQENCRRALNEQNLFLEFRDFLLRQKPLPTFQRLTCLSPAQPSATAALSHP